ncbi:MAG: hypothetical protein ACTSV2_18215 [Candidatus Thorarchaeota archaeon]
MVKEIVVMRDSGLPLFHYSVSGDKKLDELVAGFLSAMGSMAESVSHQQIKVMAFSSNKFVWERKGDLFFIALVSMEDSSEIYRAILFDLSEKFVSKYYSELRKDIVTPRDFFGFTDTVESTLQKFDGIPGLARRYKTALLPPSTLHLLKASLASIETNKDILRGAAITSDGFIIVSNHRAYETEAILDQLESLSQNISNSDSLLVVHTSLDPVTSFFILSIPHIGNAIFVVKAGNKNDYYKELVQPFLDTITTVDLDEMKRIRPIQSEESTGFFEYDVVQPTDTTARILDAAKNYFVDLSENLLANTIEVLQTINGKRTMNDIQERCGISKENMTEVIAHLIARGVARVVKIFPVMKEKDSRFMAYLEVIGMAKRDFAIVDSIWKYCDGSYSLREISNETNIPATRLMQVMRSLGSYVSLENERIHKIER